MSIIGRSIAGRGIRFAGVIWGSGRVGGIGLQGYLSWVRDDLSSRVFEVVICVAGQS